MLVSVRFVCANQFTKRITEQITRSAVACESGRQGTLRSVACHVHRTRRSLNQIVAIGKFVKTSETVSRAMVHNTR